MILAYEDGTPGNDEWHVLGQRVTARSPEAAIEAVYSEISMFQQAIAVPSSSWHVFERQASFKRVDK